uniref:Uncharacterized protein n=1 Tax=Vespula pensylvanica TaxID=30213 RepID=A0A834NQ26_VESPE|nr:hypothetical protein H0235_011995 [Vespula pensylvanica]
MRRLETVGGTSLYRRVGRPGRTADKIRCRPFTTPEFESWNVIFLTCLVAAATTTTTTITIATTTTTTTLLLLLVLLPDFSSRMRSSENQRDLSVLPTHDPPFLDGVRPSMGYEFKASHSSNPL